MKYKVQFIFTICLTLLLFVAFALPTIVIDPFLHYHKPLENFSYTLGDPRYFNDGISKFFDYNAIVTGTSMTRNFKPSEVDELWGTTTIKTPLTGASFYEISNGVKRAVEYNNDISMIIYGLDGNRMFDEKDELLYEDIPTYLYDNNIFNDVEYFLNKDIFFKETLRVVDDTENNVEMQSLDEYATSYTDLIGMEAILNIYDRIETKRKSQGSLTQEEKELIKDNIDANIVSLVTNNPQIDFYFFYPLYSIAWFDHANMSGTLEKSIEKHEYVASLLLEYENVKLHSFFTEYDIVTDFNNYRDTTHYLPHISSQILIWMEEGKHLLTTDNYQTHFDEIKEYYYNYDYDSIWEDVE